MQNKYLLVSLLILSLLGLVTSIYLVYDHYNPQLQGSVCDITAAISCAVVNSGIYSTIAGIPVAIFGVFWFFILGFLSWNLFKNKNVSKHLLGWNILGALFVVYFIYIEILLTTLCPFCTIVHVLVILSFLLSVITYKKL